MGQKVTRGAHSVTVMSWRRDLHGVILDDDGDGPVEDEDEQSEDVNGGGRR